MHNVCYARAAGWAAKHALHYIMMRQSSPEEPRNDALSAASPNSLLASSGQAWLIVMS